MPLPAFKTVVFSDRLLEVFQENVRRVLDPITRDPRSNGRLLEDDGDGTRAGIALVAGTPRVIEHGLDRELRGWLLVDNTANSVVWRGTSDGFPDRHLILECSASTTVKLEVF